MPGHEYRKSYTSRCATRGISQGQHLNIDVKQDVGEVVNGQVIGVIVHVHALSAESAFNQVIREPLEVLFREGWNEQVIILVDALDEALSYSATPTIPSLLSRVASLPSGVRFIVTARPQHEVLRSLHRADAKEISLTSGEGLAQSQRDIKQYIADELKTRSQFPVRLAPNLTLTEFTKTVEVKSAGNFLYLKYLLQMLLNQSGEINQESIEALPVKLDDIYVEFLERLKERDGRVWEEQYAPLLGTLSVAREALTEEQVAGMIGRDLAHVRRLLTALLQFLDVDESEPASKRLYTLYHRSFADFLLTEDRAQDYWCEASLYHKRIAHYCLETYGDNWLDCVDEYALQYVLDHLVAAVQQMKEPSQRHERSILLQELKRLVNNSNFMVALARQSEHNFLVFYGISLTTISGDSKDFFERNWVFQKLNGWLSSSGPRILNLKGPTASGKSVVMELLTRMSRGWVSSYTYSHLETDRLICIPFLRGQYSSSELMFTDLRFSGHLCIELLAKSPAYAYALALELEGKMAITISPSMSVSEIERHMFDYLLDGWVLRRSIERLYMSGFEKKIVVLIDDYLNKTPTSSAYPILPSLKDFVLTLPEQVRFVFTSRTGEALLEFFNHADMMMLDLVEDAPQGANEIEVQEYIIQQLDRQVSLTEPERGVLVDRFSTIAEGNFYIAYILMLFAKNDRNIINMDIMDIQAKLDEIPQVLEQAGKILVDQLLKKIREESM